MSYSDAYDTVVAESGGSIDAKTTTHTSESIRRVTALNQLYLGRPSVRKFLEAEHVKGVLAQQEAKEKTTTVS